MKTFEVSHLRLITGFHQSFKSHLHQFTNATAKDDLFTEQVRFGFFRKGRLNHTTASTTDTFCISQTKCLRFFTGTLTQCNQTGNPTAFFIFCPNQMARAFRSDQQSINTSWWCYLSKMNVKTMRAHQDVTFAQVVTNLFAVDITLNLIRKQYINKVTLLSCFSK